MRQTAILVLVLLAGCADESESLQSNAPATPQRSIDEIADAYFADTLKRFPERPTSYGFSDYRHDKLTDWSTAAVGEWYMTQRTYLNELEAIGEPDAIGSRDWITWGVMRSRLHSAMETAVCKSHLWSASTTTAWYTGLPFVFGYQPVETEQNKADAIARLSALDDYIETDIANLKRGLELGLSAPRVTVESVPEQAAALLEDNNPFLSMGERSGDATFAEAVEAVFAEQVAPAIEAYIAFIRDEYIPAARTSLAVTDHPDGDACYQALIGAFATVSPAPADIHRLGLAQMQRIQAEFREVIEAHYDGEPTSELLRRINSDPEFTFASRDAVLQYSVDALDAAKEAMPRAFGRLPKADVIIKPYPDFAASGVGSYQLAAEDGSRPGIFWIAVIDPETRTKATQKSTLYHETYPGHHLQGVIAQELGDKVHTYVRYTSNSGFSEGWALYSERVAEELGLYPNPIDMLGLLSDQGARAARLVVDTGLHTKGWTRQQAVDYMLANTGWAESDIQNDVNRYISWPAQANAYMLGMLEIQRLRALAEERLGDAFDIRDFHDRVLENGGITLPMLEQVILAWIDEIESTGDSPASVPDAA